MSFTPAFADQSAVETGGPGLVWGHPSSHQSCVRLRVLKLMAHSDGWFALMNTSSLNALLLSLLSALTTCLKLLNDLCLELKAPRRLQAY